MVGGWFGAVRRTGPKAKRPLSAVGLRPGIFGARFNSAQRRCASAACGPGARAAAASAPKVGAFGRMQRCRLIRTLARTGLGELDGTPSAVLFGRVLEYQLSTKTHNNLEASRNEEQTRPSPPQKRQARKRWDGIETDGETVSERRVSDRNCKVHYNEKLPRPWDDPRWVKLVTSANTREVRNNYTVRYNDKLPRPWDDSRWVKLVTRGAADPRYTAKSQSGADKSARTRFDQKNSGSMQILSNEALQAMSNEALMNEELLRAESKEDVSFMVFNYIDTFDCVNVATALTQISRLEGNYSDDMVQTSLARLERATQAQINHFTHKDVAQVLWSFSLLKRCPNKQLLVALEAKQVEMLPKLSGRSVSLACSAFARLRIAPSQVFMTAVYASMRERLEMRNLYLSEKDHRVVKLFSPEDLSYLCWSLMVLSSKGLLNKLPPAGILMMLNDTFVEGLYMMTAAEATYGLHALATMRAPVSEEARERMAYSDQALRECLARLENPQAIVHLVWALARMRVPLSAAFLEEVEHDIEWQVGKLDHMSVFNLVWALSFIHGHPRNRRGKKYTPTRSVINALAQCMSDNIDKFKAFEIAGTLSAFRRLKFRPCDEMIDLVQRELEHRKGSNRFRAKHRRDVEESLKHFRSVPRSRLRR